MRAAMPSPAKPLAPALPRKRAGRATSPRAAPPKISQLEPAGKTSAYSNGPSNCGPTCGAMIARATGYGESMTDAELISHLGRIGKTDKEGTPMNGLIAMGLEMGISGAIHGPGADLPW